MKYFLLFLLPLFFSCKNGDNTASDTEVNSFSQEDALKNSIQKYPDSSLLTETLIQYYRDSGLYDKAIRTVNDQLKKDSNIARLWDIKATLYFENADTANAIAAFEKAISISADPQYLISLGTLYAETKNPNALVMADALLSSKAKAEKESFFIKGLYYSYTGKKNEAITFFDNCLSISYTYMPAYTEKALALYDMQKYQAALLVLNKAVTLQNNYDEGYFYRGQVLEKLNKPLEAIDSYQSALMYDPDYEEARAALTRLGVKN